MIGFERMEYRALYIRGKQRGVKRIALVQLLRQEYVVVLDNGVVQCPLYFGGQATVAVKALKRGLLRLGVADQTIQRVVSIVAEQILLGGSHEMLRAFKVRAFEYL